MITKTWIVAGQIKEYVNFERKFVFDELDEQTQLVKRGRKGNDIILDIWNNDSMG